MRKFYIFIFFLFSLLISYTYSQNILNKDIHNLYLKAETYYKDGKYDKAINLLDEILNQDPEFISAYYLLGKIYKDFNDYKKALFYFEKSMEIRKRRSVKEKSKEEVDKSPAIESNINDVLKKIKEADELCNKAISYIENGDFQLAEETLKYAIELNPNVPEYYFRIANIYLDENLPELAKRNLRRGLKLDPKNLEKHMLLAKLYAQDSEYERAINELKKGLEYKNSEKAKKMLAKYSEKISKMNKFMIVRREGDVVIINGGFRNDFKKGMEFTTHLTVYRGGEPVKDIRTGEILGYTDEKVVGEILITRVDEKLTYAKITIENNGKIRIGDYVKFK